MIQIEVLSNYEQFADLEEAWRMLEQSGGASTIFQSWPWLRAWVNFYSQDIEPHFLLFFDRESIIGIAPFVVCSTNWRRSENSPYIKLRRLQFAASEDSDYLDLLINPGYEQVVYSALFDYLLSTAATSWDAVDLHQLREDSPFLHYLNIRATPPRVMFQCVAPRVQLPSTFTEFEATLGRSLRERIHRKRRKIHRELPVHFGIVGQSELAKEVDTLMALMQKRFGHRIPDAHPDPQAPQFYRSVASDFLTRGALRFYVLRAHDTTIASLFCFVSGGRLYQYAGGFDPMFGRYSVGALLLAYAIESAIDEGLKAFDFLRGAEKYKYEWGAIDHTNYRFIMSGRGPHATKAPRIIRREQLRRQAWELRYYEDPSFLTQPGD